MKLPERLTNRMIRPKQSILWALKKMDELGVKSLAVSEDGNILEGVLSIGDIQRAIIASINLDTQVSKILRPNPRVLYPQHDELDASEMMVKYRMEFLPVVHPETHQIVKVYYWSDFFPEKVIGPAQQFNLPVVIMAGGLGTRLRPLTNVLPKPLIPIGSKTILEEIIDRFYTYGCKNFYTSVNYKADFIEEYVKKLKLPYEITFIRENQPFGTAGSLKLLKGKISEPFFVHNCDILIETDYSEILEYHKLNKNEITIVAALKHISLPYGTIETGNKGELIQLSEKPEITFKINSGMYILEPHLLNEIPVNKIYHITDLIEQIKSRSGKVGVFPVSEKSWQDIGNWLDYLKYIKV